jgi:hypothetical protein
LTDDSLEIAKSRNDGSLIEEWFGVTPQNFMFYSILAVAAVASIGYSLK